MLRFFFGRIYITKEFPSYLARQSSDKTYKQNFVIWGFDEAIFIIKLTNIQ